MKRGFNMTTHSSVLQKHLLEGYEVSERQQHIKDVTWHLLFVLPADRRKTLWISTHFQCTAMPPSGPLQNNISEAQQVHQTNYCVSWLVAFSDTIYVTYWIQSGWVVLKWPQGSVVTSHLTWAALWKCSWWSRGSFPSAAAPGVSPAGRPTQQPWVLLWMWS